jgi:UDP-N-acetylmuramoyl-L-alanyl-D-glutamate--2,6-diaminopimelate ligase
MEGELIGRLKARAAALRYRNPARAVKLIAVAGASGKTTTALLLSEVLQEAGHSVLTLTNHGCFLNGKKIERRYDTSAGAMQRSLSFAKQKQVAFVIVEVSDAFVETHVLPTLTLEMSIVTNNSPSAQTLLNQPVNYTVVPSGFDVAGLSVAPHQAISFGDDETAEAHIKQVTLRRKGTEIELVIDHQTKVNLATHLVGQANARNVAAAASAAYVLATDLAVLDEGIARLERVAGNYDYLALPSESRPYTVAVDAAGSPESLELVLGSAAALKKRRLLVATDGPLPAGHEKQLKAYTDRLTVTKGPKGIAGVETVESQQEAFDLTVRGAKKDDLVLLIGRSFAALEPDGTTKAHRMLDVHDE